MAAEAVLLDWACSCGNPVVMESSTIGAIGKAFVLTAPGLDWRKSVEAFYSAITGRECSFLMEEPH